jgi:translation elongation factor EF-Tu-like GTPase
MTIRPPDIEADIRFVSTENGGRRSAAMSGYRPNHDFGVGKKMDASHEYVGRESVAPGETARTNMWLLAPLCEEISLHAGMKFTVREGMQVVGHGIVTRIISKPLENADRPTRPDNCS